MRELVRIYLIEARAILNVMAATAEGNDDRHIMNLKEIESLSRLAAEKLKRAQA